MATTTNYGWTTPDDTALVKDGAAAIRTLGSSVDTTTKNLNPETTLGDIAYRSSTANVKTRLGIGTTGQILAVSGGVPAWTTPASSAPASATDLIATQQGTSSGTFTDLATAGPTVTVTTGTKVLVLMSAYTYCDSSSGTSYFGCTISGASSDTVNDAKAGGFDQQNTANDMCKYTYARIYTGLTAGSNTFTMKYKRDGSGTSNFGNREIAVIDLGS